MSENECSPEAIELLKHKISGWLRQSRYRCRKSSIHTNLDLKDIIDLYELSGWKCAYCGKTAGSPDHPFPIADRAPCVQANVLPCCDSCKEKKAGSDIIKFYRNGHLTEEQLRQILKAMLVRKDGLAVRDHIKSSRAESK